MEFRRIPVKDMKIFCRIPFALERFANIMRPNARTMKSLFYSLDFFGLSQPGVFQDPKWLDIGIRGDRQVEYIKSSFSLLENAISRPEPARSISRALNGWISPFGAADNSNT